MGSNRSGFAKLAIFLSTVGFAVVAPGFAIARIEGLAQRPILATASVAGYLILIVIAAFLASVGSDLRSRWTSRLADSIDASIRRITSRFVRRYLRYVEASTTYMDAKGLGTVGDFTLRMRDVLVDLSLVTKPVASLSPDPLRAEPLLDPKRSIADWISQANGDGTPIAIIGPPGSGKTTLLRVVAHELSARRIHDRSIRLAKVPFLVNLREYRNWGLDGASSLADFLRHSIKGTGYTEPPQWIETNLRQGKLAILLDGLDEISDSPTRAKLIGWLEVQINSQPGNLLVVTSRPFGYQNNPLSGATVLEVQPFTDDQVWRYIDHWYRAVMIRSHGADNASSRLAAASGAEDLRARLEASPQLYDLAASPLLLTMMANVHHYRGALPGSRTELYAEICDVLLGKRHTARGVETLLASQQKGVVLQILAHQMMLDGVTEIPAADAEQCIAQALTGLVGNIQPHAFLRDVEEASGLLIEKERDIYGFAHLTFQEFLTAAFLARERRGDDVLAVLDEPWWRETVRMYAALTDATLVIERCLDTNGDPSMLALAVQCVEESRSVSASARRAVDDRLTPNNARTSAAARAEAAMARMLLRLTQDPVVRRHSSLSAPGITWLEYQHFMDVCATENRPITPDHWTDTIYPAGHDNRPAIGVRHSDAELFCEWMNAQSLWITSTASTARVYRLPRAPELETMAVRGLSWEPNRPWTTTSSVEARGGRFWPLLRHQPDGVRREPYGKAVSPDLRVINAYLQHDRKALVGDGAHTWDTDSSHNRSSTRMGQDLVETLRPRSLICDVGRSTTDVQMATKIAHNYVDLNPLSGVGNGDQKRLLALLSNLTTMCEVALDRRSAADRRSNRLVQLRRDVRLSLLEASTLCCRLFFTHGGGPGLPDRDQLPRPSRKEPNPSRLPTVATSVLARAFSTIYWDLVILEARLDGELDPVESVVYVREKESTVRDSILEMISSSQQADRPRGAWLRLKPIVEPALAVLALVALAPLIVVLALAIRADSSGPVLYRSLRVGRNGVPFQQFKYRTMVVNADELLRDTMHDWPPDSVVMFKMADDPRITRVGRFIRRYNLDEIPTLLNVIRGEMSFVGPRAPYRSEVESYDIAQAARLVVRPGITGPWQVSGRSYLPYDESLNLDLEYIEMSSPRLDLVILLRTFAANFSRRGFY